MNFKRRERKSKLKFMLFGIIGIAVIASVSWLVVTKFEGHAPVISVALDNEYIPAETQIPVSVHDEKSGIRRVFAAVIQDGREVTLVDRDYGQRGDDGGAYHKVNVTLDIDVREKGLKDGEALLRVAAWDRSWRQRLSGNSAYAEKQIVIDSTPPRISALTRQHNISQGGSGLVIYRLSEPCEKHGVRVGDNFFQGYSGYFEDEHVYLAFFALRHDQGSDTDISLYARDRAGNQGQSGLHHYIQNRAFDSESLNISSNFLRQVLPEFQSEPGMPVDKDPIEQFLFINNELRMRNNAKLLSLHEDSDSIMHWEGGFTALPRAQRRAGFADYWTYVKNGEVIDRGVHMGVDLASLRHAPIPAANHGKVVFADWAGIYGDTVVIDHGFGLMSLYSHLSRIDVGVGDFVSMGDTLGNTGTTGLAGGDHLHFSVIVGNVFVNPYEWWDAQWIRNNVTGKLDSIAEKVD